MKVAFYLNENRKKNLYCRISDGVERVTFSLDYCVDAKKWDPKKEEFKWDSIKDELKWTNVLVIIYCLASEDI